MTMSDSNNGTPASDAVQGVLDFNKALAIRAGVCPHHNIPLKVARIEMTTLELQVYCTASTDCEWYDRVLGQDDPGYEALMMRLDGEDFSDEGGH